MSDPRADLDRQIAELEATLALPLPDVARQAVAAKLEALRAQRAALPTASPTGGTQGSTHVSGGRVYGSAIGVNQGTVQLFFGSAPPEDAKQLLDSYLETLVADYGGLRLGKLIGKEQSGREQTVMPTLSLRKVYTTVATDGWCALDRFELERDAIVKEMDARAPDAVLPDGVWVPMLAANRGDATALGGLLRHREARYEGVESRWATARSEVAAAPDTALRGQWFAPETPIQATARFSRLVVLGSPGSGKSTLLRYLTVWMAEALLAGRQKPLPVPCFCQLGQVVSLLDDDPDHDLQALIAALLAPVVGAAGLRQGLGEAILAAWRGGGALLCLDGLDEVSGIPVATRQGMLSPRERLAEAIRRLARQIGRARLIVTCRTKPYEQDAAWQLRDDWTVRTLQPFAFGQVRHFVPLWYAQTAANPQALYTSEEAQERAIRLVAALERPQLRVLTYSPLLLTMMALLDYNHKELPEKRADVYEELVKLLLDRWEGVRSSERDRRQQSIGERLGLPHLTTDDLRPVLHELAFVAHEQAADGRGVLSGPLLRDKLDAFFARRLNPANPRGVPWEQTARCSQTFQRLLHEETGLLHEEADELYALPHLTFEEYLAACHLAEEDVPEVYRVWSSGGDRWREVLLLLMGVLLRQRKLTTAYAWLQMLLAARPGGVGKSLAQMQRDALFAAACYDALGRQVYLADRGIDVQDLEARLHDALRGLLEQPDPVMLLPQRIEAATALASLGDQRVPVSDAQWRAEPFPTTFGTPTGYWCFVRPGTYRIGGWGEERADDRGGNGGIARRLMRRGAGGAVIALPAFWIARFPVTVAQYVSFVQEGYKPDAERWWTPNGWWWMQGDDLTQPRLWDNPQYNGANQPVIGVTWYEAAAFCAWLSERLHGILPEGYVVRLPTEAEWEAAAAYNANGERHTYPWGEEEPTTERAIFDEAQLDRPAPVGCCPAGAAPCGALDLVGNVWEWMASGVEDYPDRGNELVKDLAIETIGAPPLRGSAHHVNRTNIRCAVRNCFYPDLDFDDGGFRVVVSPRLAQ